MMDDRRSTERIDRWPALAATVVAAALIVRVLHVLFTSRMNPLAADLQLDAATYDRWARALAFGGNPGPTTLMQAPLYPWFLSVVYRVVGPSLTAVRFIQALLGTATCSLVIYGTRRFFESWLAAIVAGAATALYAPLIFYEGILVPATLIVFLQALLIAILAGRRGPPGMPRSLAAGIVLGASVIGHPVALVLLPFALLHLAFMGGLHGESGANVHLGDRPRRRAPLAARAGILMAGVIIATAPLTIRNAVHTGEFILLTTGGGINFYIGNNPDANGYYAVPSYQGRSLGGTPEEQSRNMLEIASEASGRRLSQSQVSTFWFGAGLHYIRSEPRQWSALLWDKFLFFWNGYERANVENFSFHRRFPGVLRLPLVTFGLLAPLGLLGVFLTRERWRELSLLYGGILTYLFAGLAFYVLARYRLPILPFLAPFTGAAVAELAALGRSRRTAELLVSFAALAALALFCNARVARDTPIGIANAYTRLGSVYVARGDTTSAIGAYREALKSDPQNASAREALRRLEKGRNTRTEYR
jgi:hypothetical protein